MSSTLDLKYQKSLETIGGEGKVSPEVLGCLWNGEQRKQSTIHNSQDMETTQMSINRWLDSQEVVYIHNGILLSHKKEWHHAICSNMDGTRESHTEWNEPERQRQIPYDITYNWNLISSTNEHLLRKENQSWTWRRDLWLPDGRGREWEGSGAWAYQSQRRIDLQGDPAE